MLYNKNSLGYLNRWGDYVYYWPKNKTIKRRSGLTQEEFGKLFGIVKSTVSMYEKNKSTPDDSIKKKMAEHFKVLLDYLMGKSDIRNPYDEFLSQAKETI